MGAPVRSGFSAAADYTKNFVQNPLGRGGLFDLRSFMQAQRRTLKRFEIGGHSLVDPLNFFKEGSQKPPTVSAPPPAPDTAGSMLREISRAETDRDLRASKRRSMMGGAY